jgi:phage regulator Rha-like protein
MTLYEHQKMQGIAMNETKCNSELVPIELIAPFIIIIRGQRVILDSDLARLYEVTTKRLNEQVRRNQDRFPEDFTFQLTDMEEECLRSQIATSKPGRGGRRYHPYAFTEHGALMVASVLNTPRAVQLSVYVVRAFVQLREMLNNNAEMSRRLTELEARTDKHDAKIGQIIEAIRQLMLPPETPQRRIGFRSSEQEP